MRSTTWYTRHKDLIIEKYWGIEEKIDILENAIQKQPNSSRVERVWRDFELYRKITFPSAYDLFMNPIDKLTITYAIHKPTGLVILHDIFE